MLAEITLIHPDTQIEVYADIDTESGKLIGLYTYASDIKEIAEIIGRKITGRKGKNPLFNHINRKNFSIKTLLLNTFIFLPEEKDIEIIENFLNKYGYPKSFIPYIMDN